MYKLGFVGMGNMASAILSGALSSNYINGKDVIAFDINEMQVDQYQESGVAKAKSALEIVENSEMIFMAVKPQVIESVITPLKDALKNKAFISIILGYDFERYNNIVDSSTRHIFVMPNTPAKVLEGMSLIEANHNLTEDEFKFTKGLFESIGEVEVIPSHLMGVGGALSGCGPAYIYMVIEALADGAVKEGMPRALAYKLASQTVLGSGKMQKETGTHPGILKDSVTSPGGSTIRGVEALEKGAMRSLFIDAISQSIHFK